MCYRTFKGQAQCSRFHAAICSSSFQNISTSLYMCDAENKTDSERSGGFPKATQ